MVHRLKFGISAQILERAASLYLPCPTSILVKLSKSLGTLIVIVVQIADCLLSLLVNIVLRRIDEKLLKLHIW